MRVKCNRLKLVNKNKFATHCKMYINIYKKHESISPQITRECMSHLLKRIEAYSVQTNARTHTTIHFITTITTFPFIVDNGINTISKNKLEYSEKRFLMQII